MIDRLTDAQLAQRTCAVARMAGRVSDRDRPALVRMSALNSTLGKLVAEKTRRKLLRVQESSYSN